MSRILQLLFLLPILLFSEELEVRLTTKTALKPAYLSRLHAPAALHDWRYFEELRSVFEFDLNTNGFVTTLPIREDCEENLNWTDVKNYFDLSLWKKKQIPYVLAIQIIQNRFQLTAFDIEKGSSRKYPDFPLSGKIEEDRKFIHRLADTLQKDLFGIEGIASMKILYSQREKIGEEWVSAIWMADSDGANPKKVVSEKGYCLSPGFFPKALSKDSFFYVSFQEGQSKIYRSSLHQKEGEPMIHLRGSQALPAINKTGTQIAFITDVAGRPDLFVQNLDRHGKMIGKARQLYSAPRATQASPTFSPDGKKIAFVSDKDGPPRIYVMDVVSPKETKKQTPKLLTKRNRENTSPAWSPDGKKLAYSAKVEGIRQIWVYDFETEEEKALTFGPENKENPSWAPDSFHLLYNTESNDLCELYQIHLHSGDPVLIAKGLEQKRFPSWELR